MFFFFFNSQLKEMLAHLQADPEFAAHEFGSQLAALIYLRWADFQEAEREAIAAFDGTDYSPVLPASLHWRSWHALTPERMQNFFRSELPSKLWALGNGRHDPLTTNLHRMTDAVAGLGKLSPRSLRALVDWLAEQPFETPADRRALLELFDSVLLQSVKGSEGGVREAIDPKGICELVTLLGDPSSGERVYDPCFGSAGFLTAACDHVRTKVGNDFSRSASPALSISGVEVNQSVFIIGLTRLALAGIDEPNLECGNSLERPAMGSPKKEGFDLVVANPPWGGRIDPHGLDHFPIKTSDTTGLFVQHALSQLRPEGRAVIVVPQGFLFKGGQEQRLRQMLLEQHTVEAVVSLPAGTFMPYAGIVGSILILRRTGPTERVRMVDAEPFIDKSKGRGSASIGIEEAMELANSVRNPLPGAHCWDVDVATLAAAGWDLTPKRRDQSSLDSILDTLRTEVPVLELKECCRILSGSAVNSSDLTDEPSGTEVLPYIRIKDVQRGQAVKGSSWLSQEASRGVDPKAKLKAGDVLLSKSGTIGKAGVVRNAAIGAVAASGLFVLRSDQDKIDPHYLLAYLDSDECRVWLNDRARGAAIQHLSKSVLDALPVPVPPIQIQRRVAENHREHSVNALAFLTELLLADEKDPIVDWLDGALRCLSDEPTGKASELETLLHPYVLGHNFTNLQNRFSGNTPESPLAPWVVALSGATEFLWDSDDVPPGLALYSLLQQADQSFRKAVDAVQGHLPIANRARELTLAIAKRVQAAMAHLVDEVQLAFTCDTRYLNVDELVSIAITVANQGPLPLRDLVVQTTPDWGKERVGYLAESARKVLQLTGQTPRNPGEFSIQMEWQAVGMDGQRLQGVRELAFEVRESQQGGGDISTDFGPSPYVCGDPIAPERGDVFVGREYLLDKIKRQVMQTGNVVLLEGNRRSGKSSILQHLVGTKGVPGWLGVYCSLQGAEGSSAGVGVPTVEVFRAMATAIAKGVQALGGQTPLPNGIILATGNKLGIAKACREGISPESAFSDFRDYAEVILDLLKPQGLSLLMMLDEFDKLQEGIDNGVTSPQVPENIRYMVQTYPRFSAILTGSRRLRRLREEYWSALYGLGTRFNVTSLFEPAAEQLITEPVKGRLTYARDAIKQAVFLTACQPFLLQCLCNRVFDIAVQLKTRSITRDIVDQAGKALVEDNEHFASLWDYAGSDRRRYLLALCNKETSGPDRLRLGVIQERLLSVSIEVSDDDLIADLDFLRELELIELVPDSAGGYYKLSIPLMGIWIDKQRDIEAVLVKARAETEESNG